MSHFVALAALFFTVKIYLFQNYVRDGYKEAVCGDLNAWSVEGGKR